MRVRNVSICLRKVTGDRRTVFRRRARDSRRRNRLIVGARDRDRHRLRSADRIALAAVVRHRVGERHIPGLAETEILEVRTRVERVCAGGRINRDTTLTVSHIGVLERVRVRRVRLVHI